MLSDVGGGGSECSECLISLFFFISFVHMHGAVVVLSPWLLGKIRKISPFL